MTHRPAPTPDDRCKAALHVPLPDTPGLTGNGYILQCEKQPDHPGAHRIADYIIVWRTQ